MLPIVGMLASAGLDLVSKFIDAGKDKAVEVIKEKTGIDLTTKKELNEQDLLKLKQFEQRNREFLLQEIDYILKDKQNARNMRVEVIKNENASWLNKNFTDILALIVVILSFIIFGLAMLGKLPDNNFTMIIIGTLNTSLGLVLSYYFGSSIGSKEKTKLLKGK